MAAALLKHRGSRISIRHVQEDVFYEGILDSFDVNNHRLTLKNVTYYKSPGDPPQPAGGIQHFFSSQIGEVEVIEEAKKKKKDHLPEQKKEKRILKNKHIQSHLQNFCNFEDNLLGKSNDDVSEEYMKQNPKIQLCDKEHQVNDAQARDDDGFLKTYSVISEIDDEFRIALDHINQEAIIGIAFEGINISRNGTICWIQVCTAEQIILFDMVQLKGGWEAGLSDMLQSEHLIKVIHDSRAISDILYHQHDINLVNVFDTQVAPIIISRNRVGKVPMFVESLQGVVTNYLGLCDQLLQGGRKRMGLEIDDEVIWAQRPLSEKLLDNLARRVRYLRRLRRVLMEHMLADFNDGVDIYLGANRDVSADTMKTNLESSHRVPEQFGFLRRNAVNIRDSFPSRYASHNMFYRNHQKVHDVKIGYSKDSVWHAGNSTSRRISKSEGQRIRNTRAKENTHNSESKSILEMGKQALDMEEYAGRRNSKLGHKPAPSKIGETFSHKENNAEILEKKLVARASGTEIKENNTLNFLDHDEDFDAIPDFSKKNKKLSNGSDIIPSSTLSDSALLPEPLSSQPKRGIGRAALLKLCSPPSSINLPPKGRGALLQKFAN